MADNVTTSERPVSITTPRAIPSSTVPAAPVDDGTKTGAGVGFAGLILFSVVVLVIIYVRRRNAVKKAKKRSEMELRGVAVYSDDESSDGGEVLPAITVGRQDSALSEESFKYPSWKVVDARIRKMAESVMIDSTHLTLGSVLGKGQFGMVYEASLSREGARRSNDYGELTHQKVAVKTLKGSNIDKDTIEAFLREGMIMKDFRHQHVLSLIGVALGDHGIPMIVLPYMAGGNLKKYVSRADLTLTVRELLGFGLQVARGMQYLGEQKFVHRDLAARNCMLDESNIVKVADFGLSRDIYTKDYYSSQDKHAKLPVKWMALESIATSKYTTKSDVWSFGVVLWELLTRGGTPYPDVANWDVAVYIKQGRRMAMPPICPPSVYEIMRSCWEEKPEARPTFGELVTLLSDILHPRPKLPSQEPPTEEGEDEATAGDPNYINLCASVEAAKNS